MEYEDICEEYCLHEDKVARLKNSMADVSGLADLFKVLGDETRTKILYVLSLDELCVCDIATILDTTISNVSHHLRLLRAARLVKYRREGKNVFYSLDDDHVVNLFKEGFDHIKHSR